MALTGLFTHRVTVSRAAAGLGVQKTYQAVATSVPCLIQPLDDVAQQQVGGAFGKGYKCYLAIGSNVQEGDKLTDADNRLFFVKGSRSRNYGNFPHLELLLGEDKRP